MRKKCVKNGLYYNAQINRFYYITNLKNGGITVKTFYYNRYGNVYKYLNTQTINNGEVFFNSGVLVQNNLNTYLLKLEQLQPQIQEKILAYRRYKETYGL